MPGRRTDRTPAWTLAAAIVSALAVPCQADDDSAPGLIAQWSTAVSHATTLGQVDWSRCDEITTVDTIDWPVTTDPLYDGGPTDYFALRLVGQIEIPARGPWTFDLRSDAGARLYIDGAAIVNDDANHSYRLSTNTLVLEEGLHDFELRYLERNYAQGLVVEWSGPAVSTEVIPASAFTHLTVDDDDAAAGGLRAYWYDGVSHATTLGEVDWTDYDATSAVSNLSWEITTDAFRVDGPTDYFAGRFVGTIEIDETGTWTFQLGSDAGSRLLIDGQLVVNDDANHSFRFTSGTVDLDDGPHAIEVQYLERNYAQGLFLTWQGPSDAWEEVVPPDALTPASLVPPGDSGSGLNAYWTTNASHATSIGAVDWTRYDVQTLEDKISWTIRTSAFYPGGPTDYFAARFVGRVTVPESGAWMFSVGSDAGARLLVDGSVVVDDDANHSFRFASGTVALTAGAHDFDLRYLERNYAQGLVVTWRGPSDDFAEVIPASAFAPASASPFGGDVPGELRAYWNANASHATTLGEVDWSRYDVVDTVADLSWEIGTSTWYDDGPTDYFAARFVGLLDVPATGTWTFHLGSDAGARLLVDDELVVDDDANHSFRFTSGSIALTQGKHKFDVRYLERNYAQGLVVTWKGPTIAYEEVIPSSRFSLDASETIEDPGGGGLRAYWYDDVGHATRVGEVDWLYYDSVTTEEKVSWRITTSPFMVGGETDYFGVRLAGTMEIPEAGDWTFKLGSDAGARLLIDGELVVDDDANHSFRFRGGTKALTAGAHGIEIMYLERNYAQGLVATWQGPSDPYEQVIPSSVLTPEATQAPGGSGGNGLRAAWYHNEQSSLSLNDVDWNARDATTDEDSISWRIRTTPMHLGGPTDYFAARLTGTLMIPESGAWAFKLGSDAGASLIIDGTTVVDDDANHSFRFNAGAIVLDEGPHSFEVRYLERNYSQGLVVTWQGPSDGYEQVIPPSAFPQVKTRIVRWRELRPDG